MAKGKAPNPVTDADVETFHALMRKWQGLLGLNDWRVEPALKRTKSMAEVTTDRGARLASYQVGEDFGCMPVTRRSIEETVVHELLHVRLADLVHAITSRVDAESAESAEHAVVNVLEKLLIAKYAD